jgi:hypothetical protein
MKKLPSVSRELSVFRLMMMTMKERRRYKSDGCAGFLRVCLVCLVERNQPNQQNKPNQLDEPEAGSEPFKSSKFFVTIASPFFVDTSMPVAQTVRHSSIRPSLWSDWARA